ncbi:MAG TPA: hypothetical protein VK148_22990 [Xanthobacteraceae bacterium]|jgi:hypothetical protein|nr:hypothetical protein [Xanthobacteraceae bacterium]
MSTFALREACLAGGLAGLICVGTSGEVTAQRITSVPDFSSNQVGWVAVGDLTPVPGKPSPIRQDPAHRYVPNNVGGQPTYRMGDLSNPNLKPWVKEWMKKDNDEVLAGKIGYTARSSCAAAGVPGFLTYPVRPVYFIQTPKQVAMIYSGDAQVRRIYLNVPHSENPKSTWYGESVGHYEGDMLVVDTIGMNDKTFLDNYRTPHTTKLHVVERWKMVEEGKTLQVTITVEDPDAFNEPWWGVRRYRRVQEKMGEEICAENNQHLFDYQIPIASKPDF